MDDASSAVEAWKKASTHREKALVEKSLREHMKVSSVDLNVILDGASKYEVMMRTHFLLSGSEYVWSMLDEEKVQIAVVKKLLRDSVRVAKVLGRPLDDVLRESFLGSQKDAGPRSRSSLASGWDLVRESMSVIIGKELGGLLDIEKDSVMKEAMVDVDLLIRQVRARIKAKTKTGLPKDWQAGPDRSSRRDFCSDMKELGLDPPKPGRMPDMAEVKRAYRRSAADHHPDRRPDEGAKLKYERVNESYQRILVYVETRKELLK